MTKENQYKFYLSKIYGFISDIEKICNDHNCDFDVLFSNIETKHSLNMCIVQIGELANLIQKNCPNYINENFKLTKARAMRNRIIHGYGSIDYTIIKNTIKESIPELKNNICSIVDKEILEDPYMLYSEDVRNHDFIKNSKKDISEISEKPQPNPNRNAHTGVKKKKMRITPKVLKTLNIHNKYKKKITTCKIF